MLSTGAAVARPAGTVIGVSGLCIDRGRVLAPGDAVAVKDTINVPANCRLQLRLGDGSVISFAPDSSMTLASYNVAGGRDVKLWLHKGVLRAVVPPARDPSTFEVTTLFGTASVSSGSADWFLERSPICLRSGCWMGPSS
jgi:FecR protein